jgi:hypothetical protein
MLFFTACSAAPAFTSTLLPAATATALPAPTPQPMMSPKSIGAFESGQYRNLFTELLGKSDAEIADARFLQAVPDLFEKLRYTPMQP